MVMGVNTNIMALNAQNQLGKSQNEMQTAMERLSSGLRINSAKDDAAGLAISNRMTSQINGLNQAVRNANDGISLAQTAEGAVQETTNILQRMRELSIQAANGSNSASDRASLQKEVEQLQEEITRIAETSSFNGRNVLDGTLGKTDLQVGAYANETISLDFAQSVKASDIGLSGKAASAVTNTADVALEGFAGLRTSPLTWGSGDAVEINVGGNKTSVELTDGMSAADMAGEFNKAEGLYGVQATTQVGIGQFNTGTSTGDTFDLTVEGVQVFSAEALNGATASGLESSITSATKDALADKGISYSVVSDGTNDYLTFTNSDGENVDLNLSVTSDSDAASVVVASINDGAAGTAEAVIGTDTLNGTISATESKSYDVTGDLDFTNAKVDADYNTFSITASGGGSGDVLAGTAINTNLASSTSLSSVDGIDIGSAGGAQNAIDVIDAALATIDDFRADLGAVQNRLESTISNLSNISENVNAARSQIRDADFAQETSNLSRSQILQQAGTAMLSQANASQQNVLSLLG